MINFIINENDSGQRLDKFITKALPDLPKSMMYRLIRKKDIKINGKRCEVSTQLQIGDNVSVYVTQDFSGTKKHDMNFLNAPDEIDIVYEDDNIIIVNKPIGLDSHSNGSQLTDTLVNRIKHYLYNKKEYIPDSENSFSPAICSRLDRNTSGLITAAKNVVALREINKAIKNGNVHKIYHCITIAPPPKKSGILTAYHKKNESRNIVSISESPLEGYKPIKTGYKVISEKNGLCLLEITLFTGRTHQIRAHLAHIGAPILGDGKYGNISENKRLKVFRQALCAYAVKFELSQDSPLSYLNNRNIKSEKPDFEKRYFRTSSS